MRKAIRVVVLAGLLSCILYLIANRTSGDNGVQPGKPAPDFELYTLDGQKARLSDYKGKRVIVNFWATWCPPCREEMPDMQKFYESYKDAEIEILAVNLLESGSKEETIAFAEEFDIRFPILLDENGQVSNVYKATAIPTSYLIDSNGIVQHKIIGAMSYSWMVSQVTRMQ
jgi:peroxiredoxin